ncbi:MAG: hypothetical protein CMF79_03375 [Candidatus Marinimicrobia bacterium]|jgi:hypothetical protein|nr:hypothetical protein [Candidatus Neomarinimicrobiota bacterium]
MKKFKTKLITYDISGAWTFLTVPFNVEKEYGSRAKIQVKGTIDGCLPVFFQPDDHFWRIIAFPAPIVITPEKTVSC